MQTDVKQVSHGVIQIGSAPRQAPVAAPSFSAPNTNVSDAVHPVSTGEPPAPFVAHKTSEQIAAEAAQLAIDVAAAQSSAS